MADINKLAQQDYMEGMKYKDIASKYDVSINTVKSWKQRHGWVRNKGAPTDKKGAHKKRGAPTGNANAKGNTGGAPLGSKNAKGNRGGAAPPRNKNAVTTGEYETIMWDYLDEKEQALFHSIETDTIYQIDVTIRELAIRERRMMIRIQEITNGLNHKQRRVLQQMRKVKEVVHVDHPSGVHSIPVTNERLKIVEIEETEMRQIDDVLSIEDALTRITDKRLKAIKQKHEMAVAFEHKRFLELAKQELDTKQFEFRKQQENPDPDEYEDDGFLDALAGKVEEVWADDENEEA